MEINEASARLRALAKDDKKRTETARLRDVFDDVEAALKAGVSQVTVLAELQTLDFTMTMASFKSALQRIRKERVKNPPAPEVLDRSRRAIDKEEVLNRATETSEEIENKDGISRVQEVLMQPPTKYPPRKK